MHDSGLKTSLPPSLSSLALSLSARPHTRPGCMGRLMRCRLAWRPTYQRPRWVGSKGAVLTLVWNTLMFGYFGTIVNGLGRQTLQEPHLQPYSEVIINSYQAVNMMLLYPLAGWLADVYLGRYHTLRYSMWLMWVTMVTTTALITTGYAWPDNNTLATIINYGVFPLAYVLMNIGLAGFKANILPFGTDQLLEASSQQLSAYVHWFVWTLFVSQAVDQMVVFLAPAAMVLPVQALVQTTMLSLVLVSDACCGHWLTQQPSTANPLKTVLQVLRYTYRHKAPVRRPSAFTYSHTRPPSRMDLAKTMYGGQFTTEEVEDVKTFLHMLVILVALFGYFMNNIGAFRTIGHFIEHVSSIQGIKLGGHQKGIFSNVTANFNMAWIVLFTVLTIPIYELLLRPLFHWLELTMMKRAGLGMLLVLASLLAQLALETTQHITSQSRQCLLIASNTNSATTPASPQPSIALLYVPSILNVVAMLLVLIGVFEFICAQTPFAMKGLLFGAFYSSNGLFLFLAYLLNLGFVLNYKLGQGRSSKPLPSCGTWYYSVFIVIMLAGIVVFAMLANRYRQRARDETPYQQCQVEDHYMRRARVVNNRSSEMEIPTSL